MQFYYVVSSGQRIIISVLPCKISRGFKIKKEVYLKFLNINLHTQTLYNDITL